MNKYEEISKAKYERFFQDKRLSSVLMKTLENVAAERAGAPAPHDDAEIYAQVEAIKAEMNESVEGISDEAASMSPELFGVLRKNNALISAGTRINWNGTLKRAAVDLWDTVENNPDNAPDLWENIGYRDGYRIIPETITAGTAFANGEKGWWGDKLYVSLIDANVWTPLVYPQGWTEVEM